MFDTTCFLPLERFLCFLMTLLCAKYWTGIGLRTTCAARNHDQNCTTSKALHNSSSLKQINDRESERTPLKGYVRGQIMHKTQYSAVSTAQFPAPIGAGPSQGI